MGRIVAIGGGDLQSNLPINKYIVEMDKKDKRVLRDAIRGFLRTGATSLTEELKARLFSGREKKKDSDKESNNEKENN